MKKKKNIYKKFYLNKRRNIKNIRFNYIYFFYKYFTFFFKKIYMIKYVSKIFNLYFFIIFLYKKINKILYFFWKFIFQFSSKKLIYSKKRIFNYKKKKYSINLNKKKYIKFKKNYLFLKIFMLYKYKTSFINIQLYLIFYYNFLKTYFFKIYLKTLVNLFYKKKKNNFFLTLTNFNYGVIYYKSIGHFLKGSLNIKKRRKSNISFKKLIFVFKKWIMINFYTVIFNKIFFYTPFKIITKYVKWIIYGILYNGIFINELIYLWKKPHNGTKKKKKRRL